MSGISAKEIQALEEVVGIRERQAVFHILQLAEQGRFEEVVAQMVSSLALGGEMGGGQIFLMWDTIARRTLDLMMDPSAIWEGLLPGGPGNVDDLDNFNLITTREWLGLKNSTETLENVKTAFKKNYDTSDDVSDWSARLQAIGRVLRGESIENNPYEWRYTYSLWKLQDIDGPTAMVSNAPRTVEQTSVLNLADIVIEEMSKQSVGLSKDSMAMWITHDQSGLHYTMTWDQANVIRDLNYVIKQIEDITDEHPEFGIEIPDFSDQFQGIQDQMVLAGEEFQSNNPNT